MDDPFDSLALLRSAPPWSLSPAPQGPLHGAQGKLQRAAERLLHEVKLHEEVCDCPPGRPSLHHDLVIVAQAALSPQGRPTTGPLPRGAVQQPAAPAADPDGGAHDGR